ncbi:hypothetical protein [uncultured Victivallis sp.]|uniref:hypothetical protein n=1 Tax=uncultured Victivallis sp. TaxID=354118 RepID=UPI0025E2DBE5|nr:hypothetical protein [uncultured Victivallis sp.]
MNNDRNFVPAPGGGELRNAGEKGAISTGVRRIDADSPAFLSAVANCLPADVSGTVVEFHASARNRYRRFEILLIVLALCAVGWFVYLYFPRPVPAPPFHFMWQYRGPNFPGNSAYLEAYRRASGEFELEHYEAALRILRQSIEAMGENLPAGHDALFYLYFVSCENGAVESGGWRGGVSLAQRLVGYEPDNLMWRYFLVLSQRRCFPDCPEFFRQLRQGQWVGNWQRGLLDVDQALKSVRLLESKIDSRRRPLPQEKEVRTQLALFQAELLTLKWMLEGGSGTSRFPDNEDDPGVDSREEAWSIIDGRREKPFVGLKIFILGTLLGQDSWYNDIYWNGAYRGTKAPLAERLKLETRAWKGDEQ